MKNPFHAGSVVVAAMIFAIMASSISAPALLFTQTAIASTEGQSGTTIATGTTAPTAPNNATTQRVAVGGGNITLSINQFSPQTVEIQPGESVTFFAPEGSFEVHNVIFDLSNGTTISGIGVPFTMPPREFSIEAYTDLAETLLPASPYNLGEPIIQNMTNSTQAIMGFNKVAFYPAVVDQNGNVRYLDETELSNQMLQMEQAYEQGTAMPSPLSASYTIDGTENVVSSGIVLGVNEFRPPQFPFLHNFTVTFSQPGTYDYFCAFHPGMYGQVVVGSSIGEGETNLTWIIATLDQIQKGTRSMLSIVTTFWNALLKSFDAISTKPKSASVEISLIIWERKRINGKLHHAYEWKLVHNRLPEKLKEVLNSIL